MSGASSACGKAIVNSISMKEGEEEFLGQAALVKGYGAAAVVMCFDEQGQADTYERRIQIAERAVRLLTEKAGFLPQDVVVDPNVFAIGTGVLPSMRIMALTSSRRQGGSKPTSQEFW